MACVLLILFFYTLILYRYCLSSVAPQLASSYIFYWSPNSRLDSVPIVFVAVVVIVNFDSTIEICFELFVYLNHALTHMYTFEAHSNGTSHGFYFHFIRNNYLSYQSSASNNKTLYLWH